MSVLSYQVSGLLNFLLSSLPLVASVPIFEIMVLAHLFIGSILVIFRVYFVDIFLLWRVYQCYCTRERERLRGGRIGKWIDWALTVHHNPVGLFDPKVNNHGPPRTIWCVVSILFLAITSKIYIIWFFQSCAILHGLRNLKEVTIYWKTKTKLFILKVSI